MVGSRGALSWVILFVLWRACPFSFRRRTIKAKRVPQAAKMISVGFIVSLCIVFVLWVFQMCFCICGHSFRLVARGFEFLTLTWDWIWKSFRFCWRARLSICLTEFLPPFLLPFSFVFSLQCKRFSLGSPLRSSLFIISSRFVSRRTSKREEGVTLSLHIFSDMFSSKSLLLAVCSLQFLQSSGLNIVIAGGRTNGKTTCFHSERQGNTFHQHFIA